MGSIDRTVSVGMKSDLSDLSNRDVKSVP